MAAFNDQRSGSRVSFGNNGAGIGGEQQQFLPAGSCNFRDLSLGARAPSCGCRRFWLNGNNFGNREGHAFCFCGHHSCFHDAFSQIAEQPANVAVPGSATTAENTGVNNANTEPSPRPMSEPMPTGLGILAGTHPSQASINTRVWDALNAFARDQEDGNGSGIMSKLPSTAAPSLVGDTRLSPFRVLLDRAAQHQQHRSMGPPVNIPHTYGGPSAEEYSATEAATPSVQGTPTVPAIDFRASPSNMRPAQLLASGSRQAQIRLSIEAPHLQHPGRAQTAPAQPTSTPSSFSPRDIQSLLQSYGRRIDVLENLSFSQVPVEEVQEKMELFDGRLLDLEQWRGDHDQQQKQASGSPSPEASCSKRRRLLTKEGSSFGSDVSFDLSAAAQTEAVVLATLAANAETLPRIDALENRIADLEDSSLPTFARPWQVQVVLLPWGRELRGIWFSAKESTQHSMRASTQASEEWMGASPAASNLSFKASMNAAWTTESIQAWADEAMDWLSPKACGPGGTVFQRLASRGLVQEVSITSSDSRHILDTLSSSFGHVLRREDKPEKHEAGRYQCLSEKLIPLRKVRKSSRLRFLSPAEMITSSTWGASFLDSSVCMKISDGQRRLYLTTPDAYFQIWRAAWTWPALRQLPLFDASGEEQAAQAANVAIEACWSYNDRLDQPSSARPSFASSKWSTRSQPSGREEEGVDAPMDVWPSSPRTSEARPVHQRTVSLPSSISIGDRAATAALPKRRVASFETADTILDHLQPIEQISMSKRRRVSISPEAERRGVGFTPRYSREPPSPFTSDHAGESRSQATSSRNNNNNKRGNTPFAYATPHSNSNFAGCPPRMELLTNADGDTEPDTDISPLDRLMEDEWNGVDEGADEEMLDSDQDESGGEEDEDKDEDDVEGPGVFEM